MFFEWFDCHVYSSSSLFLMFERTSTGSEAFSSGDNFSSSIFACRGP